MENHKDQSKLNVEALNYVHYRTYVLDRAFILTQNNCLSVGMPYVYSEGKYIAGVKLKDIYEADRIIYLQLEVLESGRIFTVSWNLEYEGEYCMWSIGDVESVMRMVCQ